MHGILLICAILRNAIVSISEVIIRQHCTHVERKLMGCCYGVKVEANSVIVKLVNGHDIRIFIICSVCHLNRGHQSILSISDCFWLFTQHWHTLDAGEHYVVCLD